MENLSEVSSDVADAAKFKKQKLAVVDFTDLSGNVTELGRFLAEELSVSLVITGSGLEIVDRTQLNKILQEQHLAFTGVIDPTAIKKVGQLAGVDALIAGTITDLGDTIRLTLKIIATDTGSLVSAARTTIPKTGTVARLMEREVTVQRMPGQERPEVQKELSVKWEAPQKGRVVDLGTLQAVIEKLQVVGKQDLMVYIALTNKTEKDAWVIPGHPQAEKVVASDELGNTYSLKKATGMGRTQNYDNTPRAWDHEGVFLKAPPKVPVRASCILSAPQETKRGTRFNVSAELKIVTDFQQAKYFTTTATFLDVKPD